MTKDQWKRQARKAFVLGDLERFRFCAAMAREVES